MAPSHNFDSSAKYVTSYLFKPRTLAWIRLSLAVLTTGVLIFCIIFQAAVLKNAQQFFSFFTNLSYFGLCGYFWASGYQSWKYSRAVQRERPGKPARYPLQSWHWIWQYLHALLYTTIVTFPLVVTIVYWGLIHTPTEDPFKDFFEGFSDITKHSLNAAFGLFELIFTNAGPHPWLHLLWTIVILGLYVATAYITRATQGFFPYTFLDPKDLKTLFISLGGITGAQIVLFILTWGIIKLREALVWRRQTKKSDRNGVVHGDDKEKLLGSSS
ncbi:hypothetical protein MD484_g2315, partial [Candolleomyces efflorescens]